MVIFWLKHRGTIFPVPGSDVTIGRSPQHSLVVLSGERVSRRHALVRQTNGKLTIRDLKSRNGTYINDERIYGETELKPGDRIRIGDEKLEVLQRASRDVQRTVDDEAEDASTVTERNAVVLVEELVARAAETGERTAVAPTIREMIDAVLESADRMGHHLGAGESVRLMAAASVVAGWFDDGSLDIWSDNIRRQIEKT